MRYHLLILGCQMNRSDSERVRTVMDGLGGQWTDDEREADVLGVVACSVRQKAIDKVYTRIHRWNTWKQDRPLLTFVSGCVLPSDRQKFLKQFDLVFTMNELPQLPDMLRDCGVVTPISVALANERQSGRLSQKLRPAAEAEGGANRPGEPPIPRTPVHRLITVDTLTRTPHAPVRRPVMTGLWRVAATPSSPFEAFVPIQNGCDKFCTFCAVPYTRGREVSRPSADILREVGQLLDRGFQSITLLGQNVNAYGHDKPGAEMSFAALLEEIGRLGARAGRPVWVYFTSPHPRDMTPDVLDVVARHACLAKQIHLPLQAGDDKVLLRMNRQHSMSQYRAIVAAVRRTLPEATLFTDLIVGFSGETEAQAENTRRVVAEIAFNMAYVTPYSPRPGAASARWKDDIPLDEKRRRLRLLNDVLIAHAHAANQRLVGRTVPVLVTGRDAKHGCLQGLTEGKLNVRLDADEPAWIGRFVDTRITAAVSLSLAGEPRAAGQPAGRWSPAIPQECGSHPG